MAETIYVLCSLTSVLCAVLLVRGYLQYRSPLLFWSATCFVGLGLNNILLVVDLVLVPTAVDLALLRSITALAGILLLLHGLVKETR